MMLPLNIRRAWTWFWILIQNNVPSPQKKKKTLSSFCKSPKQVCLAYTSLPLFWVSSYSLLSCTSGIESSHPGSSHGLPSHLFLLSISFAQISLCQFKHLNMKLLLPNQLISFCISFFLFFFLFELRKVSGNQDCIIFRTPGRNENANIPRQLQKSTKLGIGTLSTP